jgi:ATP-binding cassette subfamily B protein
MRDLPLLLVLDEPAAALDASAEHALFERYASSAKTTARALGGITVLVSHRFSTVLMADTIAVLKGGKL